jgi:two-component system sensor histidine kinase YesM
MISFNVQPIFNHLNIDTSKKGLVAFFFNDAIIAANQTITNQNLAALLAIRNDSHSSYINGTRYLNDNIIVPNTTFRFVFMIPRNVILKNLTVISNISLLLLIITIVVLVFFSSHAVSGITNPLMQIVNGMKNVQEDKSSRIQPPNLLELQQLAEEINYTLDTIKLATEKEKRMIDDLHQSQIAQNQAMMRAYQSQIHPHFLFNTLECMRSMAHHYKIRPIETLVSSMSLMFRYSLHANLVVTLKEELQHVQHYYNVMNERFPGRYKIRISVSEEALQHPILSMILQPIAENTFSHGFVNKKNPCILYVQGKIEVIHDSKMLSLRITDNGCGISEERLQEILSDLKKPSETDKTHHIGLYNINQRLNLYFGSEYKIKINSKEGYFTQIELLIPEKS